MTAKKPATAPKKAPAAVSAKAPAKPANKKGATLDDAALDKVAGGGGRVRGTVVVNGG